MKRRVRPPSLAATISLLVLALPAILLLVYTIAIAIQEFMRLATRYDINALQPYIQPYLNVSQIPQTPEELFTGDGLETIRVALDSASTYLGVIGTGALHLFVMIAIAFYLLRDGHRLSRWGRRRFSDDAGVFFAISFVVVDSIPDFVLRPYVSGRNLHVGTVMFAYIFGPLLFGWYGIFLGPMLLVLVVHFARLVLPELLSGVPIQPAAVDPAHMVETAPTADPDPERPGSTVSETDGGEADVGAHDAVGE